MPTSEQLQAAPKATVVEPGAQLGRTPIWELFHYEHGKPVGRSIAVHKDLHDWLTEMEGDGRLIGFGWEIRDEGPPDDWPGWPIPHDMTGGALDAAAKAAARRLLARIAAEQDGPS